MSHEVHQPTTGRDTRAETIGSIWFAAITLVVIIAFSVWKYLELGWTLS